MIWLPNSDDVKGVHVELTSIFEDQDDPISPPGVKSSDLLESACSRPHTGMGGMDKYKTLEQKIAALFHSLTKNHAFHNGNKRTALVTTLTSLFRNGRRLENSVTDDEVYDFVVAVTADEYPTPDHKLNTDDVVNAISIWLKNKSIPFSIKPSPMRLLDLIKRCEQAGVKVKISKNGYILSNNQDSVRLSKTSRPINGKVIQNYLRILGLSESASGISLGEFRYGYSDERSQIHRYMAALQRLAKT